MASTLDEARSALNDFRRVHLKTLLEGEKLFCILQELNPELHGSTSVAEKEKYDRELANWQAEFGEITQRDAELMAAYSELETHRQVTERTARKPTRKQPTKWHEKFNKDHIAVTKHLEYKDRTKAVQITVPEPTKTNDTSTTQSRPDAS